MATHIKRSYTITIIDGTGDGTQRTTAAAIDGENVESAQTPFRAEAGSNAKKATAAYHYAKQAVNSIWSYEVGTIDIRTGNAREQQRAQLAYDIVNRVMDVGETALVGLLAGGVPGAIAGVATGLAMQAVNIAKSVNTMNLSQAVEAATLSQNAIRIGAGGGRTGSIE